MTPGKGHTAKVTVIIPCRNEEGFIGKVLDNILEQDYPKELLEIFAVDGQSDDRTAGIIREYASRYPRIQYLENPKKVVPHALNLAIGRATGDIILRMDAHSEYPSHYISSLSAGLEQYGCDNTGGSWVTVPGDESLIAHAIADATSHPFGIGNAHYRLETSEPRKVDTVPYGCYKREVFERIGLFDEDLARNQDDEFNARLIREGGTIYLLPDVKIIYYARKNYGKMARMFYQYGLYKPLVNIKVGSPATLRQFVPPLFILSLLGTMLSGILFPASWWIFLGVTASYLASSMVISTCIVVRKSRPVPEIPYLVTAFPLIHFSYGTGYIAGIFRFWLFRKKINPEKVKLNR